jgi:hypothetical protein
MPIKRAITDLIARDVEFQAADAAHLTDADPHPIYLTEGEANNIFHRGGTHLPFFARAGMSPAIAPGAVNSVGLSWNSIQPGFGIGELTNYCGGGAGDTFNFFRLPGTPTAAATISNRVARIDINGAYIQVSDERLKSNFSQAPGLKVILALKPQKYQHWECLGCDSDDKKILKIGRRFKEKIGFIAQELQKVLPEAVPATASEDELYGIDIACVVACSVQAIKELNEKFDQKLAAMQAQLTELKTQLQDISRRQDTSK